MSFFIFVCQNKDLIFNFSFISGSQIILSMKIISLGIDIAQGQVADMPNVFEFMGYCFNVGSVIFGPWISYSQYYKLVDNEDSISVNILKPCEIYGSFIAHPVLS